MNIKTSPEKTLKVLLIFICFLLLMNILGLIAKLYFDHDHIYGLVPLFDFNQEKNITTFYSASALFFASVLLAFISMSNKRNNVPYYSWLGLSVIFVFLSVDEISSIHERFGKPTRELLNTSGLLYYAWVIPYGIGLFIFISAYLKFILQLPKKTMIFFVSSGSIFVAGAIGLELVGGRQAELYGTNNFLYCMYYTFEEFLEMLGVAIFIYALLQYIVSKHGHISFIVTESENCKQIPAKHSS